MKRIYTIILNSDGDTYVFEYTEQEFKKQLEDRHWGNNIVYELPKGKWASDTNYWPENTVVALERLIP